MQQYRLAAATFHQAWIVVRPSSLHAKAAASSGMRLPMQCMVNVTSMTTCTLCGGLVDASLVVKHRKVFVRLPQLTERMVADFLTVYLLSELSIAGISNMHRRNIPAVQHVKATMPMRKHTNGKIAVIWIRL
jgi:hypothetical protein